MSAPTLETARLRLRPYRAGEFEAFADMWADPEVVRLITGAPSPRAASWQRFLRHAGCWSILGFGYLAIETREGGYLGQIGFMEAKRAITPSLDGTMEMGWALTPPAWGKGYAREAGEAMLAWADRERPGQRRTSFIHADHAVSIRLAERLGFRVFARIEEAGDPVVLMERG